MKTEPTQQELDQFVRINIGWCQSSLVEELLSREIVSYDEIENFYEYKCHECGASGQEQFDSEALSEDFDAKYKYMCKDCKFEFEFETEPESEPQEIFEWWLIDDWMSEKLRGLGEPVLVSDFGTWWGRTCSGQAISMDNVITRLYVSLNQNVK